MKELFSTLTFRGNKTLRNRLAVAPMTTQQSQADGNISREESEWLTRLSADGYGMVITCAASISNTATAFHHQLSLAHDLVLPGLTAVAKEMKNLGSINIVQLCHAGSRAPEKLTGQKPHSASRYSLPMIEGFQPPEALTEDQIQTIISDFAMACQRAERAGFDGIELHGANGYLFTQFISTMTNERTDPYGGSLENRARILRETVQTCRKTVSDHFIIGCRLSFEGFGIETGLDVDENIQIANWLKEDGLDYIHSSQMDFQATLKKYPDQPMISYLRNRIVHSLPLIVPGSIFRVEDAEKALSLGADVVAIGRAAIGNKGIPGRFQKRMPLDHHTPFSRKTLLELGISPGFLDYIENAPPLKSLHIVDSNT